VRVEEGRIMMVEEGRVGREGEEYSKAAVLTLLVHCPVFVDNMLLYFYNILAFLS
jgi:hypothetical protein